MLIFGKERRKKKQRKKEEGDGMVISFLFC
jgi:hypothetical protein